MTDQDAVTAVLRTFGAADRERIAAFLRKSAGRRLALADRAEERVTATDAWLNSHGLPPARPATPTADHPSDDHPSDDAPSEEVEGAVLPLPVPEPLPALGLQQALEQRRSHYRFAARPLSLGRLTDLLHHAVAISPRARQGADLPLPLSPAPSAGGHNPVCVHLAARAVEGLDAGVYTYERSAHALRTVATGDPSGSLAAVYGQPEFAARAPVTLLLTVRIGDSVARYGARHYRTLHVDTGVVVQNLYLVATALGLRGCAVAGYRDGAARHLLRCGADHLTTMLFPLGS